MNKSIIKKLIGKSNIVADIKPSQVGGKNGFYGDLSLLISKKISIKNWDDTTKDLKRYVADHDVVDPIVKKPTSKISLSLSTKTIYDYGFTTKYYIDKYEISEGQHNFIIALEEINLISICDVVVTDDGVIMFLIEKEPIIILQTITR